jgi:putative transposase
MPNRTSTIRLFPNSTQVAELKNLMVLRNKLRNLLLVIKDGHYKETKKNLTAYDLHSYIPDLVKATPELGNLYSKSAQVVGSQIARDYSSFFSLRKNGYYDAKPPKVNENVYRPASVIYNQSGYSFEDNLLKLSKVSGSISYKASYKKGQIVDVEKLNVKELRIKLINNKWLCDLIVESSSKKPNKPSSSKKKKVLAIDLGLSKLATCIDNKGNVIVLPNNAKKINEYFTKEIAKVSSKIDKKPYIEFEDEEGKKKKRPSRRRRRLQKLRRKLYNRKIAQVEQTLHIQSKKLANMNYNNIVVGDLSVKDLIENNKKSIRKSFHQSCISKFLGYLAYKCESRSNIVEEIDESYTTQTNCLTGKRFPKKVELKDRTVKLAEGLIIDRDINSAVNILKKWEVIQRQQKSNHFAALTPLLSKQSLLNMLEANCSREPPML